MRYLLIVSLVTTSFAAAQSFDVASVKISPPREGEAALIIRSETPGRVAYTNMTMRLIVSAAYGVDSNMIEGSEKALETQYDIQATYAPEDNKTVDRNRLSAMLRALLTERFGLAAHHASKEAAAYDLVVSRKGTTMKPSTDPAGNPALLAGRIVAPNASMELLAKLIATRAGRPVVDKTRITGQFDIDLKWTTDAASQAGIIGPSLFTALTEQLGLELKPSKTMVETLVIDRVNREPSE